MKRLSVAVIILCLLFSVFAGACAASLRGYDAASENYQYVLLGEYPYETDGTVRPVLWRVLEVTDNSVRLMTEYVLDTSQIIFETSQKVIDKRAYRRIETWEESDIYQYLNNDFIHKIFPDDLVISILKDEPGRGLIYPLTREEFLNTAWGFLPNPLGNHPERRAEGTPWALSNTRLYKEKNGKSPYWVATLKSPKSHLMQLVGYDGHLSYGGLARRDVGLRLSVGLDPQGFRISGGTGTSEDPFTLEILGPPVGIPAAADEDAGEEPAGEKAAAEESPDETVPEEEITEEVVTEEVVAEEEIPDKEIPREESAEEIADASAAAEAPAAEEEASAPAEEIPELPEAEKAASGKALVSFVGDCSIGDALKAVGGASSYHSVVKQNGYAWPFSRVIQYLGTDDLTVANLEVCLTENPSHKNIVYPLKAAPDHVNILLEGSIEVVNTVNNHCYDYKRQGYVDTRDTLDKAGIGHFGSVYYNKADGFNDQLVRDVNGIRFGFVGITYPQKHDQTFLIDAIAALKQEQGCDVVVISLHWGRETHMETTGSQVSLAKLLIDNGADVIYGHHPHVLQPLTFYKNKPIMFSTGNFTFGTMSKVDPHTGIFQLLYEKDGALAVLRELKVIPCQTAGSGDYRPFELKDEQERERTFSILSPGKPYKDCVNPPASFLKTGIVQLSENGEVIPDP